LNVQIRCPNPECGAALRVRAKHAGAKGRCKKCGTSFVVTGEGVSRRPDWSITPERSQVLVSTLASSPSKPASRARTPPTELPEQFGRFRILGRLGRGGMGSVYKAYDSQIHRQVALKIPHLGPEDGPDVLERFYREARIAATFDHPNLCPVYTVDQIDGVYYLAMPLLEGQPLSKWLENRHPLPQGPVAALVRMLALAMEEAHSRGVVHRDLKPSNIMADPHRLLVIVDFGLSRRSGWLDPERQSTLPAVGDGRITKAGSVLGTPGYMAPEQVYGETGAIGPACDIYSLGVILYELLTGHLPFEGPTPVVLGLIKVSEPPRPSTVRPDLAPSLEAICLKAMAKKPEERFGSMKEFAASLKVLLDHGEYTQAGMVPFELLKPTVPERDAPTSEERQLVDRLLTGSPEPDDLRPAPDELLWAKLQGIWRRYPRMTLVVLLSVAACFPVFFIIAVDQGRRGRSTAPPPRNSKTDTPPRVGSRLLQKTNAGSVNPLTGAKTVPSAPPAAVDAARFAIRDHNVGEVYHLPFRDEQQNMESHTWWSRFTPDGRAFLVGGDSGPKGDIRMWDLASGKLLRKFLPGGDPWFNGGLLLRGGERLLSWYHAQSSLLLWNLATGEIIRRFDGSAKDPFSVAASPDGKHFLAGGNEKFLDLYDVDTGEVVAKLAGHEDKSAGVFSPDGTRVLTYGPVKTLRVWDVDGGKLIHTLEGDTAACAGVFSPDGNQVLSYSTDGTVRLWDAATGAQLRSWVGRAFTFATFLPDGKKIVAWGKDRTVRVWDADTGKFMSQVFLAGRIGEALNMALTPGGQRLLTSDDGTNVYVLEVATGKQIHRFNARAVKGFSFSPDGRYAAAGSFRAGVYLWRLHD
jgi:serine/threonine protein kinase